jgi:hypothetical protein
MKKKYKRIDGKVVRIVPIKPDKPVEVKLNEHDLVKIDWVYPTELHIKGK